MSDARKWKELLEALSVPDTIPELEDSIHQHQTLIENITQAYTEVRFQTRHSGKGFSTKVEGYEANTPNVQFIFLNKVGRYQTRNISLNQQNQADRMECCGVKSLKNSAIDAT